MPGLAWGKARSTNFCGAIGPIPDHQLGAVGRRHGQGADRLAPEIAAVIEQCIERFYLTRQKLTGAALFEAVGRRVPQGRSQAAQPERRASARGGETAAPKLYGLVRGLPPRSNASVPVPGA